MATVIHEDGTVERIGGSCVPYDVLDEGERQQPMSQTTCLHPNDPQPDCGMACQECEPAAAPQAQIGAALKVAQDCRDNATGEVTAEIHIRAVMILEAAAKGILPAFCKPALDKALADYTPVCIAPTGEDFYAFDDPVQKIDEAAENYEPDPDLERDAWNETRDEEAEAMGEENVN